MKRVLAIGWVLLFGGFLASGAEQADPALENRKEPDPAELALRARLEELAPHLNGLGVSSNGDGTCSAAISMDELPDLGALKGLPVREIEMGGSMSLLLSNAVVDLSPLAGLPLKSLSIYKVPIKDLSPLKGSQLRQLSIIGTRVHDLEPLRGLQLESLNAWMTEVSDVSPLQRMPLRHLNLDVEEGIPIRDLTPLEGMALESLKFPANGVTKGVDTVRRMKSLKTINELAPEDFWKRYDADGPAREQLAKAGVRYAQLNVGSDGALSLWFHGGDIVDLAPLKGMPITALRFRESRIDDLRPLAGMALESLWIESTTLADLSPLHGMPIRSLVLLCESLPDISALKGMKLGCLRLKCPKVTDISVLRTMPLTQLDISQSGVVDLGVLKEMRIQSLVLNPEQIAKGRAILNEMKDLEAINFKDAQSLLRGDSDDKTGPDPFEK